MASVRGARLSVQLACFLCLTTWVGTTIAQTFPSSTFIFQGNDNANFTVSINVPNPSANDDLYFHMVGPASGSWYAFGFGTGMAGSLMFVAYPSANGQNVTVSPRLGTGHVMPTYTGSVGYTLLPGSGIVDDSIGTNLVANVRCVKCRSWAGGKVNVTSTKQPMIYAIGNADDQISTNDYAAIIHQHAGYGRFTLDMVNATGAAGIPSHTTVESGASHIADNGDVGGPGAGLHALFMCGTFIVLFPAGYLFLRIFERVWIHIAIQSLGLFFTLLGAASGIALGIRKHKNPHLNSPHQAIGLIVLLAVLAQFTLGLVHHRQFKRTQTPSLFGKIHLYLGPAAIAIGLINGILGLNFTGNNHAIPAYVIIVTLMAIFVSGCLYFKKRRKVRKDAYNSAAAQNFRQGTMEPQYAGVVAGDGAYYGAGGGGAGNDVPLQSVPGGRQHNEHYAPPGGPPPQYAQTAA